MKNPTPILFVIIVLIIAGSIAIGIKSTRTINWEESFNEKSSAPYGLSIFYKELPRLFSNSKIRTVFHQPDSYLKANSENGYGEHTAKGNYLIVGNSDYLEDNSVDELLNFVDNGNTLLISDYYFALKFYDTLHIETDFYYNPKDSISHLSLKNKTLPPSEIDKNEGDYFFSSFDSINYNILGYAKTDKKRVNFIEIPFGKGTIYLHLEPKAFTNYNLLKEERHQYIEGVISYLPDADIYFDSYSKVQTRYDGDVEKESNLKWFLEQLSFRWAWYTALIFGILFMVFNAKRRQRIIKIVKPLQNTTVAFVKTISNLYYETKDHKNLIDKKITYFLEKIRTDYNLDTSKLDDIFIDKLSAKSGKKKEDIKKLVTFINRLRSKSEFFEENLIHLNRHIENFYSK